jgi:hypothetical protein
MSGGGIITRKAGEIMKRNWLFFVILIVGLAGSAAAQTRTVTNADLEKFRAARVKAEQDYRENYAKWGMPSPEELERQRLQSAKDLSENAARLRAARLEEERIEAERQQRAYYNYVQPRYAPAPGYYSPYVQNYLPYGGYNSRSYGRSRNFQQIVPGNMALPTLRPPRYDFLPGSVLPSGNNRRRH